MRPVLICAMLAFAACLLSSGCTTHHEVNTTSVVEVKPMRMTIEINVRVQKDLEDFFNDVDKSGSKAPAPAPTPAPAPAPAPETK